VGRKQSNPFGLYDMHGNVWEWCEDSYLRKLPGGTDPLVAEGTYQVLRGGGWSSLSEFCRSASRNWGPPLYRNHSLGFRVARSTGQ
jgi:formylglycine-generating enzyme required for sulfatase activity